MNKKQRSQIQEITGYPSTFERVVHAIAEFGPKVRDEALLRMRSGIKSETSGSTDEILGEIAGASRSTVAAVKKLLAAGLPDIIMYHLYGGGMTIKNGADFMKLPEARQKEVVKFLKKSAPNDNSDSYNRKAVHRIINEILYNYRSL